VKPRRQSNRISLDELRFLRMNAQGLAKRRPKAALLEVVGDLVGVNAQLPSAMALSLRARLEGLTNEDLETYRIQERRVVRTWCMRGTLHLVRTEDLDWLLAAVSPAVVRGAWRWLEKRGGLSEDRARQALESVGLGTRIHHRPNELSGGQQQRVAIARALVNDPAMLMADEPTGNLDSRSGREIMELILNLNRERGTTVVIVTHDPVISTQTQRVIRLMDGEIVEDG